MDKPAAPRAVANWQRFAVGGHVLGPALAPVTIVSFSDYQCAACAYMHTEVQAILSQHAAEVALVFRHMPLSIHPAAVAAALAAECAADQGRLERFNEVIFRDQAFIGVNTWGDFARAATVPDLGRFDRCVTQREFIDRIKGDMAMARELDLHATPTFMVDGLLLTGPTAADLREEVRKAIKRRKS